MKKLTTLTLFALSISSQATVLSVHFNVDDYAKVYISTSDTVEGVQIYDKTTTWQSGGVTATGNLTAGVTNYLHIKARDAFGPPSMLIADAGLSDTNFAFSNATQFIVTNSVDWKASLSGFGAGYITPFDLGANGTGAWGATGGSGISSAARLIWTTPLGSQPGYDTGYYSIAITSTVPEPTSLVGIGLLGLLFVRRRSGRQ